MKPTLHTKSTQHDNTETDRKEIETDSKETETVTIKKRSRATIMPNASTAQAKTQSLKRQTKHKLL